MALSKLTAPNTQGRYVYGLVPYVWANVGGELGWKLPAGAVGAVDLRTLSAQGTPGPAASGFAFSAGRQAVGGAVTLSQAWHLQAEAATTRMRDVWQAANGFRPAGTTLLDLLWDQVTTGADPTGQAGPKPLMPNSQSVLQLHLGGHSLVRSVKFQWGDAHTNRIQAVLHHDFEQHWERDPDHARRVLDFWCEQHRVQDWKEFVPRKLRAHVPGRLKHQTTFTETWPTNSTVILALQDQSWNEDNQDVHVSSNYLTPATSDANAWGRCLTNLSSANHRHTATATINTATAATRAVGVSSRKSDDTARTYYLAKMLRNSTPDYVRELRKFVAGTPTQLAGDTTDPGASPLTIYSQADGSSISGAIGAFALGPVTDTGITGNLQVGYEIRSILADDTVRLDSHTAEDIAAVVVQQRLYQQRQAVHRAAFY